MPISITARWILPVDGPPISGGVITVADGMISSVEPGAGETVDFDLGDVAIIPGFVNAHTHLDLSAMQGIYPSTGSFPDWLRKVIQGRRHTISDDLPEIIARGLAEAMHSGTTTIGDISASGASWDILRQAPVHAVVFYELLGLNVERATQAWISWEQWSQSHHAEGNCYPAISPHAPYSVHRELFYKVATRISGIPVAVHLAESREELELLANHSGQFVQFLQDVNVWQADALVREVDQILGFFQHQKLLAIHGNYLADLQEFPVNGSIVYCPRTHAAFGHDRYPLQRYLEHRINIAIGTDSLASNPDLDMFAELRFLRQQFPDLPGQTLLRMGTINGAVALGLEHLTGSITPGKSADLVCVAISPEWDHAPYESIFTESTTVIRVLSQGKWLR